MTNTTMQQKRPYSGWDKRPNECFPTYVKRKETARKVAFHRMREKYGDGKFAERSPKKRWVDCPVTTRNFALRGLFQPTGTGMGVGF